MQNLKKLQYIVLNLGSGSCGSHRFLCCGPLTCRFQHNIMAHHHRTIEISPLSLYLGTKMSKQSMCFTIKHQILFNFSISNSKQTAR